MRGFPDLAMESLDPAVKMIRRIIDDEVVGLALQLKFPAGDAAGHATGDRAKVGMPLFVVREGAQAKHDITPKFPWRSGANR